MLITPIKDGVILPLTINRSILQSWMEHFISKYHKIILTLIAKDFPVQGHLLSNQEDIPTLDKCHDSKLATLTATCGIHDALPTPFLSCTFRKKI
jgi:hypothetical protein